MNIIAFNQLCKDNKIVHTWQFGVRLAERQEDEYDVELYHVYGAFVEILYSPGKYCVEDVRSFEKVSCVDPYLKQIDISSLNSSA
jgi:hypothetical protein